MLFIGIYRVIRNADRLKKYPALSDKKATVAGGEK